MHTPRLVHDASEVSVSALKETHVISRRSLWEEEEKGEEEKK